MNRPTPITYDEVMSKLEELKGRPYKDRLFTAQMEKLLIEARTPDKEGRVVSYARLQELWKELGWGEIAVSTLCGRYKQIKKRLDI